MEAVPRDAGKTTAAAAAGPIPAAVTGASVPPDWPAPASPASPRSVAVLPAASDTPHNGHSALPQPSLAVRGSSAASTAYTAWRRGAAAIILRRSKQRARHRASLATHSAAPRRRCRAAAVGAAVPGQPDIMEHDAPGPAAMGLVTPVPPAVPPARVRGTAFAPVAAGATLSGQQLHGDGDVGGGQAAVAMDLQAPLPQPVLPAAAEPTDLAGAGVPAGLLDPPVDRDHAAAQHMGGDAVPTTSAAGVQAVAQGPGGSAYSATPPQPGEVSWQTRISGWDLRHGSVSMSNKVASSGAFGTAWHQDLQRLLSSAAVSMSKGMAAQRDMMHPLDVVDEDTGATHRVELRAVVEVQGGRMRRWRAYVVKLTRKLRGKVAEGDTLVFRSAGPAYGSGGGGTAAAALPAAAAQEPGRDGALAMGNAGVDAPMAAGAACAGAGLPQPAAIARVWMRHVPRQPQGGGDAAASAAGVVAAGGGKGRCGGSSSSSGGSGGSGGSSSISISSDGDGDSEDSDGDGDSEDCDDDDDDDDDEYHPERRPPGCAVGRQPPAGVTRMTASGRGGQRSGGTAGTGAQGRGPRHAPWSTAAAAAQRHGKQPAAAALYRPDDNGMPALPARGPVAASPAPCVGWTCALTATHIDGHGSFYLPAVTDAGCGATFRPYLDALRRGSCKGGGGVYQSGRGTPTVSVAVENRLQPQLGPQPAKDLVIVMHSRGRRTPTGEFYLRRGITKLLQEAGLREGDTITFSRHSVPQVTAGQRGGGVGNGAAAASRLPGLMLTCSRQGARPQSEVGVPVDQLGSDTAAASAPRVTGSRRQAAEGAAAALGGWQCTAGAEAAAGPLAVASPVVATPAPGLDASAQAAAAADIRPAPYARRAATGLGGGTEARGLSRPELHGRPAAASGGHSAARGGAAERSSAAGTTGTDEPPSALVAEWSCVIRAAHVRQQGPTFGLPVLVDRNCRATFQPFVDALRSGSCTNVEGGPACSASAPPAGPASCRQPVAYLSGKGTPTVSVAVDNRLQPQLGPQPAAELRIAMYTMCRPGRGAASHLHLLGITKLLQEGGLRAGDTITFSRSSVRLPQGTAGQHDVGAGAAAASPLRLPALITLTCSRRNRGNEQDAARPQGNEEEEEDEDEEVEAGAEEQEPAGPQCCAAHALTGNEDYGEQLAGTAAPPGRIAGSERAAAPLKGAIPEVGPVGGLASPACGPAAVTAPAVVVPRAQVPGRAPATSGLQATRPPPRSAVPAAVPPAWSDGRQPAAVTAAGPADAAPAARGRPAAGNSAVAPSPVAAATAAEDRGPPSTPPAQSTALAARGQQSRCSQSPPRKRAKHSGVGTAPPQQHQAEGGRGAGGEPVWHCAAGTARQPQAVPCQPTAGALPCPQSAGLPEQHGASSAAGASGPDHYPPPGGGASTSALLAPQALPEAVPSTVLIDACDEVLAAVEVLFPRPSMAALAALADALSAAPTHWPPVRQSQLVRQLLPRLRGAVRVGGEAGALRAAVYVKSFLAVDMMGL